MNRGAGLGQECLRMHWGMEWGYTGINWSEGLGSGCTVMQSWDGDAFRCIRTQVWEALELGFRMGMYHNAKLKRGKTPSFGETNFFFTLLPLSPFITSSSHKQMLGSSKHPFFQEEGDRRGHYFQRPPWPTESLSQPRLLQ